MPNPQPPPDYYAILQVDRQASQAAIKQAYRQLARQYHPDLNPQDRAAADRFKTLNEAYQVLSDGPSRRQYDRYGPHWKTAQAPHSVYRSPRPEDDFDAMEFGRHGRFEDLLGDLLNRYS